MAPFDVEISLKMHIFLQKMQFDDADYMKNVQRVIWGYHVKYF